jgi:glycerol-3-phosphate O-acyltransferase
VFNPITLPLWVVVLLGAAAAWLVLERLLVPSVRFFLRRRVNRVLDEVNKRLQIHVQPFKLTKRKVLIDRLMYDPQVMEAAEAYGQSEEMPREVVLGKVERYAKEIVPSFNAYIYFRFGYWLARQLGRTLYRVRLGYADEAALEKVQPNSTIVFVMNHRSNMDYVLVAYLVAERAALSYAVGEWARIFPLESLIRSMGAYFVRRKSRNALYRKVLARYVAMATREGVTQAVYPEGGLSRNGELLPPKLGLFDYMLRDFDPRGERDLVFVPVGLNYDRVLEDRTLVADTGTGTGTGTGSGPEKKTGLAAVLTTLAFVWQNFRLWISGQWHRFGYACVDFGSPVSAREYLGERNLDPRSLEPSERFAEVGKLAELIMARVGDVVPAVPVALVASALVSNPGRRWTKLELKAAVQRRIAELETSGAQVYIPRADDDYAIEVGLRTLVLRHLVSDDGGHLSVSPGELPLLEYYANSIGHLGMSRGPEVPGS